MTVMNALDGKIAVVTGAGRGIGREYALALARAGATIVVNDVGLSVEGDEEADSPADSVVREIEGVGGRAAPSYDSVTTAAGAARIIATAVEHFGGVDILVANAGIIRPTTIRGADPKDWDDVFAVHAAGTFHCLRQATPELIERGGGTIITVGTLVTEVLYPRLAAYRAAKAAIATLTIYAAEELGKYGINVNSVFPGGTATRMSRRFVESLGEDTDNFLESRRSWQTANEPAEPAVAPAATVPPLGVFLCTEQGREITGRSFELRGTDIGIVDTRSSIRYLTPTDTGWSMEELGRRIPAALDDGA
jgi:NAD(P)-dependent dehydrogenase (short-subunit alcohol dehydrogenase family)